MQLEINFRTTTISFHKYLSITNDWMLQPVLFYNAGKNAHSISKQWLLSVGLRAETERFIMVAQD